MKIKKEILRRDFLKILGASAVVYSFSCGKDEKDEKEEKEEQETDEETERNILIAYFSWSGNTKKVAENIAKHTGGALFRIETVNPYPTEYIPCTQAARAEKDNGVRPELKTTVEDLEQYDTVFVGCPVWWWTAPMAVWSFLESDKYDFSKKTIIPFCTYENTYRDATLAKIVELTPNSKHLKGFGPTEINANVESWLNVNVENWLKEIGMISNK
jgi:flavodoxin